MKRANLIINILIYFSARGYVSDAAFMNSKDGALPLPPYPPLGHTHRESSQEKRAGVSTKKEFWQV